MTDKKEPKAGFIGRKGELVGASREDHYVNPPVGKAYGFFDCDASKKAIESELPHIREAVLTPSELELSLIEGMDNVRGDPELMSLAQDAKEEGNRYVLEATYPGATNRLTAKELSAIFNQAYQSPLYQAKGPFKGEIVFEEGGEYLIWESEM